MDQNSDDLKNIWNQLFYVLIVNKRMESKVWLDNIYKNNKIANKFNK